MLSGVPVGSQIQDQTGKEWLDEHVYVDERGCKDYISADKKTAVWATEDILDECYHILDKSKDKDFEE